MTQDMYGELMWLPRKPADFVDRCKALPERGEPPGPALRALARHALDANELARLAKAVARSRAEGRSLEPLVPFRLGVVSNATSSLLVPALGATALRHGIDLEVVEADFDQILLEILSPGSRLN